MGTSLKQGERIALSVGQYNLSQITIGLGWDAQSMKPAEIPSMHIGSSRHQEEFDLDAIAVLLNENQKIQDLGSHDASGSGRSTGDVVFHRSMQHGSGAIWLTADNRTGQGDGDDEQIVVRLAEIPAIYKSIVFMVVIHDGKHRGQNFARVANAFIRVRDAQGEEICRFNISTSAAFAEYCALTFAEVVREDEHWVMRAIGQGHTSDRFTELLRPYL